MHGKTFGVVTMEKKLDDRIAVRIDSETKIAFSERVELEGKSISETMLQLIKEYLDRQPTHPSKIEEVSIQVKRLQNKVEHLESVVLGKSPA